jgi:hypothetical protein
LQALSLQFELSFKIGVFHTFGLGFGPGFQPYSFDQTQVEDLGVMRSLGGAVGIGVEVVTGEIGTVTTEIKAFLLDASINITGFTHLQNRDGPILRAAAFTNGLFLGNSQI